MERDTDISEMIKLQSIFNHQKMIHETFFGWLK